MSSRRFFFALASSAGLFASFLVFFAVWELLFNEGFALDSDGSARSRLRDYSLFYGQSPHIRRTHSKKSSTGHSSRIRRTWISAGENNSYSPEVACKGFKADTHKSIAKRRESPPGSVVSICMDNKPAGLSLFTGAKINGTKSFESLRCRKVHSLQSGDHRSVVKALKKDLHEFSVNPFQGRSILPSAYLFQLPATFNPKSGSIPVHGSERNRPPRFFRTPLWP